MKVQYILNILTEKNIKNTTCYCSKTTISSISTLTVIIPGDSKTCFILNIGEKNPQFLQIIYQRLLVNEK